MQAVADERGVPMAQVALAWVLKNPVVSAPIVGPPGPATSPTPSPRSTSG
jgi:aryl-alcohol dehydrogenase-like predicted oxidoreductase